MPTIECAVPAKMIALEQTIIRANGRVEHLGVVNYWHVKRICRWLFAVERLARRLRTYYESK